MKLLPKPAFSTYFEHTYTHIYIYTHTCTLFLSRFTTIGSPGRGSDQSAAHSTSGDPYSIIWMHAIQTPALCKLIASNWKTFSASPNPHALLLSPSPSIVNLKRLSVPCPALATIIVQNSPFSSFLCFSVQRY